MTKKKMALIIIVSILAAAIIGVSIWLITVDATSRKVNLVNAAKLTAPDPVSGEIFEDDIELEDVTMRYAVLGKGYPLILIHGNGSNHKNLEGLMRRLANNYTVYALDSRSQGESSYTDDISYRLMAKDVKQFIEKKGLVKPYVIGHSDGGIVALQMAIDYPDLMGAFVSCGANTTPKAFKLYFTIAINTSYAFKHKPLDRIMVEEPDFSAEQLQSIKVPAYILAGEFDIVKLSNTKFIADNIKGSKVAILKWQDHSSYMRKNNQMCCRLAMDFFESL